MSTRGLYGFRLQGKDYLSYNHFDSYPSGLGLQLQTQLIYLLKEYGLEVLKEQVVKLKLVAAGVMPKGQPLKQIQKQKHYKVYPNMTFYDVLRPQQGDYIQTLLTGVMTDDHRFIEDSLFCEWAYIANFDDEVFEVYQGLNREDNPIYRGRYVKKIKDDYLPCYLAQAIKFCDLELTKIVEDE